MIKVLYPLGLSNQDFEPELDLVNCSTAELELWFKGSKFEIDMGLEPLALGDTPELDVSLDVSLDSEFVEIELATPVVVQADVLSSKSQELVSLLNSSIAQLKVVADQIISRQTELLTLLTKESSK